MSATSESITLSELLAEIGNDKLGLQLLSQNLHGNQKLVNRRRELQVSFVTDSKNVDLADLVHNRPMKREALIIWVDRAEMDAALARLKRRKGIG